MFVILFLNFEQGTLIFDFWSSPLRKSYIANPCSLFLILFFFLNFEQGMMIFDFWSCILRKSYIANPCSLLLIFWISNKEWWFLILEVTHFVNRTSLILVRYSFILNFEQGILIFDFRRNHFVNRTSLILVRYSFFEFRTRNSDFWFLK